MLMCAPAETCQSIAMISSMDEEFSFKQQNAWRSKFRSRHHDKAHEQTTEIKHDYKGRTDIFRGKPVIIDRQGELEALIGRLREAGSFAYDSEFIGEMSYVPRLCLVQIGTTTEIALVDPLADLDLTPLWELLADPQVRKIVHAGGQDMEPVARLLGRPAENVIDTQIASGFARLPYPISLQRLVLQLMGIKLGKGLTFTHWDQRPLTGPQTRYAADDVRFLPAVWNELEPTIRAAGTMDWVQEECRAMCQSIPYQFDPEVSFLRIRGCATLDARQLGILRELAIWRDAAARKADLPPRTYLRDDILIEMTRQAPGNEEKLLKIKGLPRPIRVAHTEAILQAIREGAQKPVTKPLEMRKTEELPRQQFQTDAIHALAQTLCLGRGVDPQLAITRSDTSELLTRLRRNESADDLRIMTGWRRELVGQAIADLYTRGGELRVSVHAQQVRATPHSGEML